MHSISLVVVYTFGLVMSSKLNYIHIVHQLNWIFVFENPTPLWNDQLVIECKYYRTSNTTNISQTTSWLQSEYWISSMIAYLANSEVILNCAVVVCSRGTDTNIP